MNTKKLLIVISIVIICVVVLSTAGYFLMKLYHKMNLQNIVRQHYEDRVELFEKENAQLNGKDINVLFLGDSITEGYNLQSFYPQYKTLNRGINADTTFTLEKRLKVSAYDVQPEICVMLIGTNNYDDMFDNFDSMLVDMKNNMPDTKIIILSLTPVGNNWIADSQTVIEKNRELYKLTQKHNCRYVDVFTPLYDEKSACIYNQYTTDGVHLTESGYEVITRTLTPVLEATQK